MIADFAPLLRDAVIAGHDRDEVTALLIPDLDACRGCQDLPADARDAGRRRCGLQERLDASPARRTGSSNRVARALLLDEPLSIDAGEVTDKGSINQRAVLAQRAHLVEELYRRTLLAARPGRGATGSRPR